ncbi:unnamed protein product [Ranitomeya imitator]|uniref:Reverse transcriptase domain-containing protein n=1 Tax=Ranitomeya imitator TaxID=111125 RepID=A0ABN9KTC6_9NEOB|nr:unnamed protein product [Ranitomeya imitator]
MSQEAFQDLKAKNQETLRTHRLDLEKKKRSKFLRDTEDYLKNRVYQWREPHRGFRSSDLPKFLRLGRQQTWYLKYLHIQQFFRQQPGPFKRKTRRGGQCRRGLQKPHVDQITGTQPQLVINISSKSMDTSQLTLLQKGLSFCPTYKFNSLELNMDLQRFFRNLRLRVYFSTQLPAGDPPSQAGQSLLGLRGLGLRSPSSFMPPKNSPPIETFISLVERDIDAFHRDLHLGKFHFHNNLSPSEKLALDQLSAGKTLVVKPADKGGVIVIMDRADYMEEAYRQLNDSDIYRATSQNPLNNIAQKSKTLLEFHEQEGTIDNKLRSFLTKTDPITPIFYLLPEIHKRLFKPPGRPIVSLTDSILSPPAIVLEKILTPLVKSTSSFILDTNDFLGLIRTLGTIPSSSLLVTWDVSSLYTSITHEKGILAVDRLLNEAGTHIKIRRFCTDLLTLVLRENYFMFEDTFFIQQQGTTMGSHVAPPYAIAYMSSFEQDFVYTHPLFQSHSRIWRRYIDDIFCIWDGPIDSLISFDKYLNNVWPELKFTLQYNMDRISFLDTLICKNDCESLDRTTCTMFTILGTVYTSYGQVVLLNDTFGFNISCNGKREKIPNATKSLDTPHLKIFLYFHDYENCTFTLKASKL